MPAPFSPLHLVLFITALTVLIAVVQFGLISVAFDKLGLSPYSAFLLLISSLIGSVINLPLFAIKSTPPKEMPPNPIFGLLRPPMVEFTGTTKIAINVGGGLIPLVFSIYLLKHNPLPATDILLGVLSMTVIGFFISRPVYGIGIGMPVLIAPLCAALIAVMLNPEYSAPLAYISGTLGVLMGADIMRLKNIGDMGLPMASIGGAGTFDGIFLTGIVAVLLA